MLHTIALEARQERAWNSPEAKRRRECAQANEDTAAQMLRALSNAELTAHVEALDAEHRIKRAALQSASDALARALNEQWKRSNG